MQPTYVHSIYPSQFSHFKQMAFFYLEYINKASTIELVQFKSDEFITIFSKFLGFDNYQDLLMHGFSIIGEDNFLDIGLLSSYNFQTNSDIFLKSLIDNVNDDSFSSMDDYLEFVRSIVNFKRVINANEIVLENYWDDDCYRIIASSRDTKYKIDCASNALDLINDKKPNHELGFGMREYESEYFRIFHLLKRWGANISPSNYMLEHCNGNLIPDSDILINSYKRLMAAKNSDEQELIAQEIDKYCRYKLDASANPFDFELYGPFSVLNHAHIATDNGIYILSTYFKVFPSVFHNLQKLYVWNDITI
ncbi:hypothetical protein AB7W14_00395 [Providencia rettgeri]|uniref:hypothetical protein n=1 Tax=Providencia sp. PROV247 TaxID=2949938 RepID=UPI00234B39DB|nr:hypothetical protein [Providencia sp. PROV247]